MGDDYLIEGSDIELNINKNSFFQNDNLSLIEFENDIFIDDESSVFHDKVYNLNVENSDYFNQPVELTLEYDENIIPEGVSEYSVFCCNGGLRGEHLLSGW
jgi:hypothetical protein